MRNDKTAENGELHPWEHFDSLIELTDECKNQVRNIEQYIDMLIFEVEHFVDEVDCEINPYNPRRVVRETTQVFVLEQIVIALESEMSHLSDLHHALPLPAQWLNLKPLADCKVKLYDKLRLYREDYDTHSAAPDYQPHPLQNDPDLERACILAALDNIHDLGKSLVQLTRDIERTPCRQSLEQMLPHYLDLHRKENQRALKARARKLLKQHADPQRHLEEEYADNSLVQLYLKRADLTLTLQHAARRRSHTLSDLPALLEYILLSELLDPPAPQPTPVPAPPPTPDPKPTPTPAPEPPSVVSHSLTPHQRQMMRKAVEYGLQSETPEGGYRWEKSVSLREYFLGRLLCGDSCQDSLWIGKGTLPADLCNQLYGVTKSGHYRSKQLCAHARVPRDHSLVDALFDRQKNNGPKTQ